MKGFVPSAVLVLVACLIDHINTTAIVNGTPVGFDEFPFMAALGWRNNLTGKEDYLCGGALITPSFVLTAAHCVFFEERVPDIVQIGGFPLESGINEIHVIRHHFVFPEYNSSQAYNDIALLQLSKPSRKGLAIWWNDSSNASTTIAIGYGTTEFAGNKSNSLLKVDLTIVSNESCQEFFKNKRKVKLGIQPTHICAGDPEGKKDTCQGDSGGPLLQNNIYIIGITSFGQACSGVPPAVYTRVSQFRDWIRKVIVR